MSRNTGHNALIAAAAAASVAAVFIARLNLPALPVALAALAAPALLLVLRRRLIRQDMTTEPPAAEAPAPVESVCDWAPGVLAATDAPVLACDRSHRVLFASKSAAALLNRPAIAPGTGLFSLLAREPVLHALDGADSSDGKAPLACAAADAGRLFSGDLIAGDGWYALLFSNSADADAGESEAALRRGVVRDLRRPLANMRAAAETISAFPGMAPRERAAFDEVIVEECAAMTSVIETLEQQAAQAAAQIRAVDLHSQDLFNCLARDAARDRIGLNMVGLPLWLHGDSQGLPACLGVLIRRLSQALGLDAFDFEALLADRRIYIDISWSGPPIPAATVDLWLDDRISDEHRSLRDVFDAHGSEPWSQSVNDGRAVLRLPLPPPERPQFRSGDRPVQPRPEMHDYDLLARHMDVGGMAHVKLSEIAFVVFDSETTGLRPDQGDRLLQIGAVRVQGGKVLSGETFERLIDPGRPIPPESIPYHGITDDMVRGKPPLPVIMPQFAVFAGNAVLAGHNVAFDLKFLRAAQSETGIALRNPVVDTLLLAALLDPGYDLSLDAVAERLGVPALPRRSALTDAMTTAEILVRLLAAHKSRGIETLGQLSQACMMSFAKGDG